MGISIAIQMGGVSRYKWEAYCNTNGRSTEVFPFPESSVAPTAIQIGGVLQYKLEAYCNTFLRSSGGWGFGHSSEHFKWVWSRSYSEVNHVFLQKHE